MNNIKREINEAITNINATNQRVDAMINSNNADLDEIGNDLDDLLNSL